MKRIFIASLLSLTAVLFISVNRSTASQSAKIQSVAQPVPTPGLPLATIRRDFKNSLPIPVSEKLEYEVKYSRIGLNLTVGVVTFEYLGVVANKTTGENQPANTPTEPLIKGLNIEFNPPPGEQFLHLRATAVSKGWVTSFLDKVNNRYETLVDANDFSAKLNLTEINEGKKQTVQSAVYDRATQQVKYLTTDLTKPNAPPTPKFLPLQEGMMSLLSALYFVRLQKYKEGQMLRFPVSYGEENYQFDIVIGKREKIKTECGKIKTVKLEPKLFGPGKFFSREGQMVIWVSDDDKHVPLRLMAKTSAGSISAKLINFKQKCQILDPEAEKPQK